MRNQKRKLSSTSKANSWNGTAVKDGQLQTAVPGAPAVDSQRGSEMHTLRRDSLFWQYEDDEDVFLSIDNICTIPIHRSSSKSRHRAVSNVSQSTEDNFAAIRKAVELNSRRPLADSGCYFTDGVRLVDFVLCFKQQPIREENAAEQKLHALYRREFETLLLNIGLQLEYEASFVKIHAPWNFLALQAELTQFRIPMHINEVYPHSTNYRHFIECLLNTLREPKPISESVDFFLGPFDRRTVEKALPNLHDRNRLFSTTQRIQLVYGALRHLTMGHVTHGASGPEDYGNEIARTLRLQSNATELEVSVENACPKSNIGLQWLLKHGVYSASYPLHDSEYKYDGLKEDPFQFNDDKELPSRFWLYRHWVHVTRWRSPQPIRAIRDYLGDQYAFYFAWLGFYTKALIFPAFFSLLALLFGVVYATKSFEVAEICNSDELVCPACAAHHCRPEPLKHSCSYAKMTAVFDNYSTPLFALMLSVWAVVFVELWKRRENTLAAYWNSTEPDPVQEEPERPGYQTGTHGKGFNPVTRRVEGRTRWQVVRGYTLSVCTLLFWCALVLAFAASLIAYRVVASAAISRWPGRFFRDHSEMMSNFSSSLLHLGVILVLKRVYRRVALMLTEYECQRTEREFQASFTYKFICFQFVNYFTGVFYLAFVRGLAAELPGPDSGRLERCPASGCMTALCVHIFVLATLKPTVQNIKELLWPWLRNQWRSSRKLAKTGYDKKSNEQFTKNGSTNNKNQFSSSYDQFTRCERTMVLAAAPAIDLVDDYVELVLQYSLLTMFAAAMPVGAVFAVLNNVLEMRIDAYKFIVHFRRPIARAARGIGPWLRVLQVVTTMAVVCNGLVVVLTSDIIDRMMYRVVVSPSGGNHSFVDQMFTRFSCADYSKGAAQCRLGHPDDSANENHSTELLRAFNRSTSVYCIFRDYRIDFDSRLVGVVTGVKRYDRSPFWWQLLTAKLVFFIIFEHVVFLVQFLVRYCIADVPNHVLLRAERERHLKQKELTEIVQKREEKRVLAQRHLQQLKQHQQQQRKLLLKRTRKVDKMEN